MLLPTPRHHNTKQLSLLPLTVFNNYMMQMRIRNLGHARTLVGGFFECATAALTGATQLKTDGRCDYCPDLELDQGDDILGNPPIYIECKSIGVHRTTTLYQSRIEKDLQFINGHEVNLFYFFWRHSVNVLQHKYTDTLFDDLAAKFISLIVIEFYELHTILSKLELRQWYKEKIIKDGSVMAGKKSGFGKEGYDKGWQPSVSLLLELKPQVNIVLPNFGFIEPMFRNGIKINAPQITFAGLCNGQDYTRQQIDKLLPLYIDNYRIL